MSWTSPLTPRSCCNGVLVQVMWEGAVEPLVACIASKRVSAQMQCTASAALLDIAKHGPEQAARIVDAGEHLENSWFPESADECRRAAAGMRTPSHKVSRLAV